MSSQPLPLPDAAPAMPPVAWKAQQTNASASLETELKFQVPAARGAAVQRAMATSTAQTQRLRARYFDTPDRRLASAGLALRLRQEGRRWVQTVKDAGDGHLERLEHEVPLVGRRGVPGIDIARHAGTAVGAALELALGEQVSQLEPVFETDVRRTCRIVRCAGASIEVALDIGELRAGKTRLPIFELEFELERGPLAGLFVLARRWAERHGLWLDVRSKAERGGQLARGVVAGPPARFTRPKLAPDMPADAALRAMVAACLAQVLPNAAELAAGGGGPEHLHQARVGLRRLRAALRVFGGWSADTDAAWEPGLADLFAQLGAARDLDMVAASIFPQLLAAGAPFDKSILRRHEDLPGPTLRAPSFGQLMLDLIAFAHGAPAPGAGTADVQPAALATLARPCLQDMHRRLKRDAADFHTQADVQRHRTRKRLKRLRYSIELVAALYPPKGLRRTLARLQPAQEALGEYNDLIVAEAVFRERVEHDARVWFAIGWLAARRAPLLDAAARALKNLAKAQAFWRRRPA